MYILQHVVGRRELDERQQLACDVTGDGRVTALDAARVLELTVGRIDRFPVTLPCHSDWLFVVGDSSGGVETVSCAQPSIVVEPSMALDVEAVLPGDCTGNWESSAGAVSQRVEVRRNSPTVRMGRTRVRGSKVLLPIYLQSPVAYHSIDLEVAYQAHEVLPVRIRMLGQRRGGLVQMQALPNGRARVAVANPEAISRRGRRRVLILEFEMAPGAPADHAPPSIDLLNLRLDERQAQIH